MIGTIIVALCAIAAVSGATEDRLCIPLSPNVTDSDYYDRCSRCSAGQGMTQYCAIVNNLNSQRCGKDTLCSECVSGTYQDRNRHVDHCQICKTCDMEKGLQVLKPCTSVSNTECGCAPGSYFDISLDRCVQCTRCHTGTEPSGCFNNSDTVCTPCANGTYSDGQSSCKPCRTCVTEQLVKSACTAHNDTVCTEQQHTPGTYPNQIESNEWMIYLSCCLMALIVIAVIVYALCKHCNPHMDKKRTNVCLPDDASVQLYACATHKPEADAQQFQDKNNATAVNMATEPDSRSAARASNGHAKGKSNRAWINRDRDTTQLQVLIDEESERTST